MSRKYTKEYVVKNISKIPIQGSSDHIPSSGPKLHLSIYGRNNQNQKRRQICLFTKKYDFIHIKTFTLIYIRSLQRFVLIKSQRFRKFNLNFEVRIFLYNYDSYHLELKVYYLPM